MHFVRHAELIEVIDACDPDQGTQRVLRAHAPYGVWRFSVDDIGSVGAQLQTGEVGTVAGLLGPWGTWLRRTEAEKDRTTHGHFLEQLRRGQSFEKRPILYWAPGHTARHVLDGRHRLFAAFDYGRGVALAIEVFWSERASGRRPP